jgi:glycosyltransferase involved in cell wall biosynthesis
MGKTNSKENDVRVTVGMCLKNSETTVKEAIESLLEQKYPHELMELIIVDGYSRDKTLRIIMETLKKTDIQYRIFYENEGLGRARQIVVDNSNGKYIAWVDGDMILSEDFVRKQVEFMDHNPHAGISKGKYGVRTDGKKEKLVAVLENVEFMLSTMSEGEAGLKSLGTSGCIYRVSAIKQVGGFDANIDGAAEDTDIENRIRMGGWQLHITPASFYETRRQTWRLLWKEYFWHGKGGRTLFEKNRRFINFRKMLPLMALVYEVRHVPKAYRLTHQKKVLWLPFHYVFKRTGWFLGFLTRMFEKSKK